MATLPSGDLVAGGTFATAGGVSASCIVRWDGTSWHPLGSGMSGGFPYVFDLSALPSGELVAGGWFTSAGGVSANDIARWDGANWHPLGSGMNDPVLALTTLPNGEMVAGGEFTTAGAQASAYLARYRVCVPCPADFTTTARSTHRISSTS